MKKLFFFLVFFTTFAFLFASPTLASVRCETQYGGGEVCVRTGEVQIDKKIWSRATNSFVDNIWQNNEVFRAGDEVVFRLKVKNVGDRTLDRVDVWDSLPGELVLTSGSLNYSIFNLAAGAVDEREIRARVIDPNRLPAWVCPENVAEAKSGDNHDRDAAKFCIENRVLGKGKRIPKTGPEMLILGLLPFIGGAGFYMTKLKGVKHERKR